jgi:GNAT superfamily N-acetyltransferase
MNFGGVTGDALADVRKAWIEVWIRASDAGGAIGFAEPVGPAEIAPLVDIELTAAAAGTSMIGAVRDAAGVPVAFAVIRLSTSPVQRHWGDLLRVMVDPAYQDRGVGRRLVTGMHGLGRDLGLRQLHLTARSGLGLERFYAGLGYAEFGRHPDAIKVGPEEFRDEIHMVTRL